MSSPHHRRHWAAFLFALVGLAGVVWFYLDGIDQQIQTQRRARDVLGSVQSTLVDMLDIETGLRGYLLSGRKEFLRPYYEGAGRLVRDEATLRARTGGDATAYTKADTLISEVMAEFATQIDLMDSGGKLAAQKRFDDFPTKPIMDQIRVQLAQVNAADSARLWAGRSGLDRSIGTAKLMVVGLIVAMSAVAFAGLVGLIPMPGGD